MLNVKKIRAAIGYRADTIGRNKAGHLILRKGFFYTNGQTTEKYANNIKAALENAGIDIVNDVKLVDKGMIWKPFRGGAKTAQQSHFYVELSD